MWPTATSRTPRRKFIVADTPGHEQYTRNMATGASTADVAIMLIDARKGILPQTRAPCHIAWLLGVRRFAFAVNKMDLVDFREEVFDEIQAQAAPLLAHAGRRTPTSSRSARWMATTSWQLLHADALVHRPKPARSDGNRCSRRLRRARSASRCRWSSGRIWIFAAMPARSPAARIRPGDEVVALPSGTHHPRQTHRHLRRRSRSGVRADVGDTGTRSRNRRLARRPGSSPPAARRKALAA